MKKGSKRKGEQSHTKPKVKRLSRTHKPEDMTLEEWQVRLRQQFGREQDFLMENIGDHPVFSEYSVTNPETGKNYSVSIRGEGIGLNYCSCPDFSVNTLGTCKHIEFALAQLGKTKRNSQLLQSGYVPPFSEVYLRHGAQRLVAFSAGTESPEGLKQMASHYFDSEGFLREDAFARFDGFLEEAGKFGHELRCYDNVLAFIAEKRDAEQRQTVIEQRYLDDL